MEEAAVERAIPGKNINYSDLLIEQPSLKYLGFALLLSWHYCLWFVPSVFPATFLLDDMITFSWLIELSSSALALFVIPLILGRKRHLTDIPQLVWVVPFILCAGTLLFALVTSTLATPWPSYGLNVIIGVAAALLWTLWGERYARTKARFSIKCIAPVVGIMLLVTLLISVFLPSVLATIFVACLPLISGLILIVTKKHTEKRSFPTLLPRDIARQSWKTIVIVCSISFITSIACYFFVAIIPWEDLPDVGLSFTSGIFCGAVLMLFLGLTSLLFNDKADIFKLFPWLLVITAVSGLFILVDGHLNFSSFLLSLTVYAIFEVLLVMYFGILTIKGYTMPAVAFGLSGGFIRLGIVVGNSMAIIYERTPGLSAVLTAPTILVFIAALMALLIPLVRQEYNIFSLTSVPATSSNLDKICQSIRVEFGLSERESEIVHLIARGYSSNSIAEKLVISPYTVNTHIQHIYEKMNIHKRAELFSYINMQTLDG
jgi:DNA-binding CsgD family transcriptional regulator